MRRSRSNAGGAPRRAALLGAALFCAHSAHAMHLGAPMRQLAPAWGNKVSMSPAPAAPADPAAGARAAADFRGKDVLLVLAADAALGADLA